MMAAAWVQVHLIASRTATGSSARFAAAFATCFLNWQQGAFLSPQQPPPLGAAVPPGPIKPAASSDAVLTPSEGRQGETMPSHKRHRITQPAAMATMADMQPVLERYGGFRLACPRAAGGHLALSHVPSERAGQVGASSRREQATRLAEHLPRASGDFGPHHLTCAGWLPGNRSAAIMGEYRNIMNLCRVLSHGTDAKLAVDEAVDRCSLIGDPPSPAQITIKCPS